MLKRRIIPKLLLERDSTGHDFRLVTTKFFSDSKPVGHPVSQARIYQAQNVDELMLVDIESRDPDESTLACVTRLAEEIFMPITIGGGVSKLQHFEELLSSGADKVSINTAALKNRTLVGKAAERFGSQCVVVSIDYRMIGADRPVFCRGGAESADIDAIEWSRICEAEGAGEILLTNIERDGMRNGLDTETIAAVCGSVSIPVIASGGCGLAMHFSDGMKAGASAVAAGTFFCSQDQSPMQCRSHIKNAGLPVRMQL